jgi:hypothetical protein
MKHVKAKQGIQFSYTFMGSSHTWFQDLCLVHTARCTRIHLHQLLKCNNINARLAVWSHWLYINYTHAPRLLVPGPHRLYINHAMRREYSSLRRIGSTSTTPHVRVPWLLAQPVVDYFAHVVRSGASAARAARCRLLRLCCASGCLGFAFSVALAPAMLSVTASRGVTTRRPSCTGSVVPMLCIRTHRLAARLLVGRLRWLLSCTRSLRHAS